MVPPVPTLGGYGVLVLAVALGLGIAVTWRRPLLGVGVMAVLLGAVTLGDGGQSRPSGHSRWGRIPFPTLEAQ